MADHSSFHTGNGSGGDTDAPLRQLLEEMIWAWASDIVMQEFTGRPNTEVTHTAILKEIQERCLVPLRDAGIIFSWVISLTKHKNQMQLNVEIQLPQKAEVHASH